jgi:DNA-binding NtrC family response regulator
MLAVQFGARQKSIRMKGSDNFQMVLKFKSIIAIDDDQRVLDQISTLLDSTYNVLKTSDPHRAMGWLQNNATVTAIVVEQVLRNGRGIDLLSAAQKLRPDVRRILIANYADLTAIVGSLHTGDIQRTIFKPIVPNELLSVLGASSPEICPASGVRGVKAGAA